MKNRNRLAVGGYAVLAGACVALVGTVSALPGVVGDALSLGQPAFVVDAAPAPDADGRPAAADEDRADRTAPRIEPGAPTSVDPDPLDPPPPFAGVVPEETAQVVRTVRTDQWCAKKWCSRTEAWERVDGRWRIATTGAGEPAVFRSTIGPKGFAAPGKRREDDLKSPSGVYGITVTFSTGDTAPGAMPWRQRQRTSVIGLKQGKNYNTWLENPHERAGARASMRYGFWIDYNHPRLTRGVGPAPTPGLGSAIFYHTAAKGQEWIPTFGCTQVGRVADMAWIVRWLDPAQHPRVVQNI